MDQAILWLDEIDGGATASAGPKISRLAELRRIGLRVPDGFVVTTAMFRKFFVQAGLDRAIERRIASLDPARLADLREAAAEVERMVLDVDLPASVVEAVSEAYEELCYKRGEIDIATAVRSSATDEDSGTASFAGQYVTHLGISSVEDVIAATRSCWASFFNDRALAYRLANRLSHWDRPMAVGIIALVPARSSGVAFSVHPVTHQPSRIVVEGSWGWGEAVVQGLVTPDRVEVDKDDGRILDYTIADKKIVSVFDHRKGRVVERPMPSRFRNSRVLEAAEIAALVRSVRTIEAHYGVPVDVEWVMDRTLPHDPVTIVQTRPITTLANKQVQEPQWDPMAYAGRYAMSGSGVRK
ncbi:PEP/pyruvate-binding domain-containing protein [Bradyrhizobium tropiciagri]|uniref:PEP/pyruvate-binding domain-containing protein n=1 Tax=Bradyrhizobium tropiciagri TaxID=312253 RepID=UPI001BACF2E2|nr:PEP/pyruvate-binding domain-containing protein [Bradyrhizobium tropiciagri]MBR0896768.1 PEP/pyruvate-binding domain-containing protein [Bradyrhizobium tropiciagri]